MLKIKDYLIFSLPRNWASLCSIYPAWKWTWLDQEKVRRFFSQEKKLCNIFGRFLEEGFTGLVWYHGDTWVSYAWMSLPETAGPWHLPRNIRKLPVYWIFYCRTKHEYQRQGLFKASLNLFCQWAREKDHNARIYIDTTPENIPSRQAIKSIGFLPAGIITTLYLGLPKVSWILWGKWDKKAPHPRMPEETDL